MIASEILAQTAKAGLLLQQPDGSMPSGHNGPHNDEETPVRNTSNWLLIFLDAFRQTGNSTFREAALQAVHYLMQPSLRPGNASWIHLVKKRPYLDHANGLIGQAWSLIALSEASRLLDDLSVHKLCNDVFEKHSFDRHQGLWRDLNINGSIGDINWTLNQQLWFAFAGMRIYRNVQKMPDSIQFFCEQTPKILKLRPDRIFYHTIARRRRAAMKRYMLSIGGRHYHWQEAGYHAFTLMGLSLLLSERPNLFPLKTTRVYKTALDRARSIQFREELDRVPFAYGYNPTGFEMATILSLPASDAVFAGNKTRCYAEVQHWLKEQVNRHHDNDSCLMTRNSPDPWTLASRVSALYPFDFATDRFLMNGLNFNLQNDRSRLN